MKLLVVILNYRVTDLTIACLRSLAPRIGGVPGSRVAVCENGSGGDAEERLRAVIEREGWSSWCTLTVVHPNRGFTGGNNLVVRAALASPDPPEYVLLLNSDTLVHDGALEALVAVMDANARAGIAGSRLLDDGGAIQASPFRFPGLASEFTAALQLGIVHRMLRGWWVVPPPPDQAGTCEWVSGASMILRRALLEEVGLLDEGLYTYFDDVDICMRARRAGWETWFVPASRITHLEGAATGIADGQTKRRPAYWFQARRRFFLTHYGPLRTAAIDIAVLVGLALRGVRRWVQRRPDAGLPRYLLDFFQNSVLRAGFRVTEVQNPALQAPPGAMPPAGAGLDTGPARVAARRGPV